MITSMFEQLGHLVTYTDLWVIHGLNLLFGNWVVDHTIGFISGSKLVKGALPLAIYWYYWFDNAADRTGNRAILVKGALAALLAIVFARFLAQLLPTRLRPLADPAAGFLWWPDSNQGFDYENWSAFPSDTAALVFALSWSLLHISRACSVFLLGYSALIICIPRVYIGLHYPSDIVVGALIGILSSWVVQRATMSRLAASPIIKGEGHHPLFYALAFFFTSELAQMFENVRAIGRTTWKLLHNLHQPGIAAGLVAVAVVLAGVLATAFVVLWRISPWQNRRVKRKAGS